MGPIAALRLAARRLLRAPSFAAAAALTLALGIGGTVAVFSVVDGVLLRPLPFPRADRLVDLSHTLAVAGLTRVDQSDATFLLYRRDNRVFSDLGAYRAQSVNFASLSSNSDAAPAERLDAASVTPGLFRVLRTAPARGRGFAEADAQPGAPPVALISHGLWTRDFGGAPSAIGRTIVVDGVERRIVGVMAAGFDIPGDRASLWLPLVLDPTHVNSAAFDYRAIARLRDGVTIAAAAADLQRLLPQVPVVFPGRLTATGIAVTHMAAVVRPLRDVVVGHVARTLWTVLGAVGALLLLACANVAGLFVARGEGRRREFAVRRALGAGRAALLLEFLAESVLLSAVGGALGLALAAAGVAWLRRLPMAAAIPRIGEARVDGAAVAAAMAGSLFAAVSVSILPLLRSGAAPPALLLAGQGRAATAGRSRQRTRRALVVLQVALALVLVAGTALFARSFQRLSAVDPGFDAARGLAFRVALPPAEYPSAGDAARAVVAGLDAVRRLPGVEAAGAATRLPLDAEASQDSAVFVEDRPVPAGKLPDIHEMVFATPGYFAAMGIPLVAGRLFGPPDPSLDPARAPREVVVSEAFARRYWSAGGAVGRRIRMNPRDPWSTIVGVVGSVRDAGLERAPAATVYLPLVTADAAGAAWTPRDLAFVVRAAGAADPAALAGPARRALARVAPAVPLFRVMPLRALLSAAVSRTTFTLLLVGVAALVALAVGWTGIYGVVAYLVALRTREIGVRLALGARPADVRRMIVSGALADAAIGVAIGLAGAAAVTRGLGALLFGVAATD
ncbi:MAG: ABC transporter permease, partial [Gemmatimonadota bacterium]|nr:ABC transporter permease [Gemmatimonadota bacterium]